MSSLNWKGDQVKLDVLLNVSKALGEFALTVEGEAKRELRRGHGVLTGTLRRSIHTAMPGYNWGSDDVEPKSGTAQLGNVRNDAVMENGNLTVQVGSGLKYAMAVHQGHGNFAGYHFLTNGLKKANTKLPNIIAKYKVKR